MVPGEEFAMASMHWPQFLIKRAFGRESTFGLAICSAKRRIVYLRAEIAYGRPPTAFAAASGRLIRMGCAIMASSNWSSVSASSASPRTS